MYDLMTPDTLRRFRNFTNNRTQYIKSRKINLMM